MTRPVLAEVSRSILPFLYGLGMGQVGRRVTQGRLLHDMRQDSIRRRQQGVFLLKGQHESDHRLLGPTWSPLTVSSSA